MKLQYSQICIKRDYIFKIKTRDTRDVCEICHALIKPIKYNIHYPRISSHFLLAQVTLAWNLSVPSKVY